MKYPAYKPPSSHVYRRVLMMSSQTFIKIVTSYFLNLSAINDSMNQLIYIIGIGMPTKMNFIICGCFKSHISIRCTHAFKSIYFMNLPCTSIISKIKWIVISPPMYIVTIHSRRKVHSTATSRTKIREIIQYIFLRQIPARA